MKVMRIGLGLGLLLLFDIWMLRTASAQETRYSQPSRRPLQAPQKSPVAGVRDQQPNADIGQILQNIEQKLAAVQEYSCTLINSYQVAPTEMSYSEERCFRRPNLFFSKQTQLKHSAIPDMVGQVIYLVADGRYIWEYIQHAAGSGQKLIARIDRAGRMSAADKERLLKQHEAPQLFRYDLQRFRQAGYSEGDKITWPDLLLNPFQTCERSSLRLLGGDANAWVFSALPNPVRGGGGKLRLTLGKQDGILQRVEFLDQQGRVTGSVTIWQVKLNPGLEQNLYTFNPPKGVEIQDITDSLISSLQRQGVQPRSAAQVTTPTPK